MIALSVVPRFLQALADAVWRHRHPWDGPAGAAFVPSGPEMGIGAAFTHSLLQMLMRFDAPPAKTFGAFAVVILLDYGIAFTVVERHRSLGSRSEPQRQRGGWEPVRCA